MIRLRLLGSIALVHEDGSSVRSLLAQPKRFALLSYLAASPSPHRRDTLLGLLWPEADEEHARRALRQSLHRLRQSLGPRVIVGDGNELLSVDGKRLWCDAAAFAAAAKRGRHEEALDLYRGPFLEGFHLSGTPAFERWVEGERRRLRLAAVEAAWRLAAEAEGRSEARRWAEQALELAPYNEEGLRRYLVLMAEHGQPAAAVQAYEAFANRLTTDLELEPSAETVALAERIRAGESSAAPADALGLPPAVDPEPPAAGRAEAVGEARASVTSAEEGSRELSQGSGRPDATRRPGRSWKRAAGLGVTVALLVAVGGWALISAFGREAPEIQRLAVLPLANLTGDPGQDYFVAGMHDALVAELGRVADLMVVSRQSVLRYQGSAEPLSAIARDLGVEALVEGSVFLAGDSVRITAQLVRATPEEHLWTDSYRGSLSEALALQTEVARAIAAAVQGRLTARAGERLAAAPPVTRRAQDAYLRGLHYVERHALGTAGSEPPQDETIRTAIAYLEEAVALEPEWAAAHAKLALAYHWLAGGPFGVEQEFYPKSKAAALRALELDDTEAQAHASLGFVLFRHERDWAGAERAIRRALELEASAWNHWIYSLYLRATGRYDEAVTHFRLAEERNPLSRILKEQLTTTYFCAGRYDEAVAQAEHVTSLWPERERSMRFLLGNVYSVTGRHAEAIAAFERAVALSDSASWAILGLAYAHARAGSHEEARRLLAHEEPEDWPSILHVTLGDVEQAVAAVEADFGRRGIGEFWERCFPEWDTLRAHPRIREMLYEMGLAT